MAISEALRAADSPATDYAEQIVEEVRKRIQADDWVLEQARSRRDAVLKAAQRFEGALSSFGSGSLAHRTVNDPVSDGDGGVVLDRRTWTELGPDSEVGDGPDDVMDEIGACVCDELRDEYPRIEFELTKRAILFSFRDPIDDEDPTVDLVVCLTRRGKPGYWIPNRDHDRWDASDPEKHTALMTAEPKSRRVHRARVIRLAKAAIKNDENAVLCSWNISALALTHITVTGKLSESLAGFFDDMADSVEQGPTKDPADVSAPIKLPDGMTRERAVKRLRYFADRVAEAVEHRDDHARALTALGEVFSTQLPDAPKSAKQSLAGMLRRGNTSPAVAAVFGSVSKTPASFGDAAA
jgi:hypothetical protein